MTKNFVGSSLLLLFLDPGSGMDKNPQHWEWGIQNKTSEKNPGLLTAYSPYGTYCMVPYWLWSTMQFLRKLCAFSGRICWWPLLNILAAYCVSILEIPFGPVENSKPIWLILGCECADTPKLEKTIGMCSVVDLDLVGSYQNPPM